MNTQKSNSVGRFGSARLRNQSATNSVKEVDAKIKTKSSVMNPLRTNPSKSIIINSNKSMTNLEHSSDTPKTTLVVIPLEQLTEMITTVFQLELKKHQAQHPHTAPEDEFLNATETIAFLRVSRLTYQKLRHSGELPAIQASQGRILFKKSDLIEFLNSRKEARN